MRFAQDNLEKATENDIIAATPDPADSEIDLVWTEFVPLGINLILNDKSGKVKVCTIPFLPSVLHVLLKKMTLYLTHH